VQSGASSFYPLTQPNPTNNGYPVLDWEYVSSNFCGGSGTISDPFLICDAQDLVDLSNNVKYGGNQYNGIYFKLANDIDMYGVTFTPIGTTTFSFNGDFNGDNKTIRNLEITANGLSGVGLFGNVNTVTPSATAKIHDLTLHSGNIITSGNCSNVGLIAGNESGATFYNVKVTNSQIQMQDATNSVGGFVGYNSGKIDYCHVKGITIYGVSNNASNIVGGFAGERRGVIDSCSVEDVQIFSVNSKIGGMIGSSSKDNDLGLTNSYVRDVQITALGDMVGGFIGEDHCCGTRTTVNLLC